MQQANKPDVVAPAAVSPAVDRVKMKTVVATRRGYYGNQIRDPFGDEKERAPFLVPVDTKSTWMAEVQERPKAPVVDDTDIG